jgi:hypothetical protein
VDRSSADTKTSAAAIGAELRQVRDSAVMPFLWIIPLRAHPIESAQVGTAPDSLDD